MKGRVFQSNFSMGVLDEEFHGRVDLEVSTAALADSANLIPASSGAARRRAGFLDEGAPKHADKAARFIPFRRSALDQVLIEFGDGYVRFWGMDGAPVLSGGTPYEIVSPYGEANLAGLRFAQSNDVLYLCHDSRLLPPRVLKRASATSWSFGLLERRNGPWRPANATAALTVEISDTSGSVNITVGGVGFLTPQHVGSRIRLFPAEGQSGGRSWAPGTTFQPNELVLSDGKHYRRVPGGGFWGTATTSGTTPPLHDTGTVSDGALAWEYVSDGAAVVLITAVTNPTTATGTVERKPPSGTVDGGGRIIHDTSGGALPFGPSARWELEAFSEIYGYPGACAFSDDDRLFFSGSASRPGRYHATRTAGYGADYADFTPGLGTGRVLDDDALNRAVRGEADRIEWLIGAAQMAFGTTSCAGVIQGETLEDPVSPAANRARSLILEGCAGQPPSLAHDGVIFTVLGRRGLQFMRLGPDGALSDIDLSFFGEDLMGRRIAGHVWAARPDRVLWIWFDDGSLASLTFNPRQNQWGLAPHPLPGGFLVEDAAVLQDGDGRDGLWLIVRRTKDEAPQRRIWRQAARWRTGDPLDRIVYLDASRLYEGAPVTTLTGLEHLAGEAVVCHGDEGAKISQGQVSEAGTLSVPVAVSKAVVGLAYDTFGESLDLDVGGPGEGLGAQQRALSVAIFLADAVEARVSFAGFPTEEDLGKPWAADPRPRDLVFKAKVGSDSSRRQRWKVETNASWPLTLRAARAVVSFDDD